MIAVPGFTWRKGCQSCAASSSVGVSLRRDWGYEGLLLTDDLNMGAVYRLGIGESAVAALAAGVDLLLVTYDPDRYFRAMHAASEALRRGVLDDAALENSRRRLAKAGAPVVSAVAALQKTGVAAAGEPKFQ